MAVALWRSAAFWWDCLISMSESVMWIPVTGGVTVANVQPYEMLLSLAQLPCLQCNDCLSQVPTLVLTLSRTRIHSLVSGRMCVWQLEQSSVLCFCQQCATTLHYVNMSWLSKWMVVSTAHLFGCLPTSICPLNCCLLSCRTQSAATIASQTLLHSKGGKFRTQPAPGPDEMNWPALWKTSQQIEIRGILVFPFVSALLLLPIGFFAGGLSMLNTYICGDEGSKQYRGAEWYCDDGSFMKSLVSGIVPSVLITLWQNWLLPIGLYYFIQVRCPHVLLWPVSCTFSLSLILLLWFGE